MTTTTLAARGRLLVTGTGEVLAADPAALIQQHHVTGWLRAGIAVLLCDATTPDAPCLDDHGRCTGHTHLHRHSHARTGDRLIIGRRGTTPGRVVYHVTAVGTAGVLITREA